MERASWPGDVPAMVRKGLVLTAVLALVWAGLGLATPAADPKTCLVVDTDVGVDNYRALAVVAPARDVRAVVVTEGISGEPNGTTAMSMFLATRAAGSRVAEPAHLRLAAAGPRGGGADEQPASTTSRRARPRPEGRCTWTCPRRHRTTRHRRWWTGWRRPGCRDC